MTKQQIAKTAAHAVSREVSDADMNLIRGIASGDDRAVGEFVDRWASSFFAVTGELRMTMEAGDVVVEEVFRRIMFEAPRFVARPDKFHDWLSATFRDCAAATIARRKASERNREPLASARSVTESCSLLLRDGRLAEALCYLNSLTPFRFTGIYRFDGMFVQNIHLFDRESGFASDNSSSPAFETYCLWIQETLSVVQMRDSLSDSRALTHPKRESVRSYCGGPICSNSGDLLGTICHFDYESRETPTGLLALLESVSPLLVNAVSTRQPA